MPPPLSNADRLENERLNGVHDQLRAQIAELAGRTDEASSNLRAAMEALLNSGGSAAQLQAAATPLIARAVEIQVSGPSQQAHLLAYQLSEEMLAAEQRRLAGVEASLFDDQFQSDLRAAFERGGSDLADRHDAATQDTLDALERIDAALAEEGLSREERQALLEQRHAVLYAYTGELSTLLEEAEARGVEGLEPLAQRVREQREALEASALSPQERNAKLAEASREAAAVAASFDAADANIILADAANTETALLNARSGEQDIGAPVLIFEDADPTDLSYLMSSTGRSGTSNSNEIELA